MKSNILKRIDDFSKRHLLLSSFLCLIILSIFLNLYMGYALPISSLLPKFIDRIIGLVVPSIIDTLFIGTTPIFVISILLYRFLKEKTPAVSNLTYYKKFFLSFIPTLAMIIFVLIRTARYASSSYANPPYPYQLALLTSLVYSATFAAYFGWYSRASKLKIIAQCIIISILMGFCNKFIYEFATSGLG